MVLQRHIIHHIEQVLVRHVFTPQFVNISLGDIAVIGQLILCVHCTGIILLNLRLLRLIHVLPIAFDKIPCEACGTEKLFLFERSGGKFFDQLLRVLRPFFRCKCDRHAGKLIGELHILDHCIHILVRQGEVVGLVISNHLDISIDNLNEQRLFVFGYVLCALVELKMLGVEIDPGYEEKLKQTAAARVKENQRRKLQRAGKDLEGFLEQDENFYYIVGYTPGGAPYGITWEEYEGMEEGEEIV